MEAEFTQALLARADDRLILGHRLSEWCGHGPVLEEDLALANIALDLLGQAQTLYGWCGERLRPERSADQLVFFRGPTDYRNLLLVEQPNGDFAETLVRQFLYDSHDLLWLAAFADHPGCRGELATWVAGAQVEARYHHRHSSGWLLRLGDGTDESHTRCQRALDSLWTFCDELFVADATAGDDASAALRSLWQEQVAEHLERATLRLPDPLAVPATGGRSGIHSEHLERLLSEMQSLARAHPGAEW